MKKHARSARTARFHHDGELQGNTELTLSKTASHHLVTVLRARQGDIIELFNGDGCNYLATVIETGQRSPGKQAVLQLQTALAANSESPLNITLLQGISRGDRMDASIRQSVELGVSHVQPLYTRHSAKALDEKRTAKKIEHWQAILVSACEQSGRAKLPSLAAPMELTQWLQQDCTNVDRQLPRHTFVLDPTANESLVSHLHKLPAETTTGGPSACDVPNYDIGLIVGPESGLDIGEIETSVAAGAISVTLGRRILRTETAGPACLAIVQAILGDLT